ncbi:MAG: efflux RND transporter periplasmic adaptor subunit [Gallionellaceae bacterium]|nr:efflux RND transporter periplasmic adaptor subunit [Gallionellaceae bacterium]
MNKFFLLLPLLLAACEKPSAPPPEPLRPVKTLQVGATPAQGGLSLAGEVRARHEAPLAFRVAGKITECKFNLGDTVQHGQLLARLDPEDYRLSEQASAASVAENKSGQTLAEAELTRFRSLHEKGFVSAAMLDQKQAAADAARAKAEAALSSREQKTRQLDYTRLLADSDGIVTAKECNAGQVVNAGQPVLYLAQKGEKEIAVHVPEGSLADFRASRSFAVALNAHSTKTYTGVLRELAAAADPATRTYAARITVKDADSSVLLGMSATVHLRVEGDSSIRLPLGAIVSRDNQPRVWKVDEAGAVHATPISIDRVEGDSVRVTGGLNPGDRVVTAGTNLLRDGEKVKLLP